MVFARALTMCDLAHTHARAPPCPSSCCLGHVETWVIGPEDRVAFDAIDNYLTNVQEVSNTNAAVIAMSLWWFRF